MSKYTRADLTLVSGMNKERLREGCKAAGIKGYGGMNNDQMRRALQKHIETNLVLAPESVAQVVVTTPAALATEEPLVVPAAALVGQPQASVAPKDARNGVTKPKAGSLCLAVWEACDGLVALGQETSFDAIKQKLPNHNDATIRTQRQRWKTYHAQSQR